MKRNKNIIPGKPGASITLLFALAAVAMSVLPELGVIGIVILVASVAYISSARAPLPVMLVPFAGAVLAYFRGGALFAGAVIALVIASAISGYILSRGGFHRALMAFIFIMLTVSVTAVAVYTKLADVSAAELLETYKSFIHDVIANAVSTAGDKLTLEDAQFMIQQYEEILGTMFIYAPAVLAAGIGIVGVIALRLNGFLHDTTGSIMYPRARRFAIVSKPFAVIYFAAMVISVLDAGIVGLTGVNVMLSLLVPGAAAGVTSMRAAIRERRASGKRGFPFTLLLVILVTLGISVVTGIMVLATLGCIDSLKKKSPDKIGK